MPKKLIYGEVKQYIEDNKSILLSEQYFNNCSKLEIQCSLGHKYEMSFHDFRSGCRCPVCYKKSKEITRQDAEEYLRKYGYELIGEYKNTQEKIKIKCSNNHITEMAFCQFKSNGHRCKFCTNNNIRHDYNYIKDALNERGYVLIDKEYINNTQKLNVICPQGHKIQMTWTLFKMGVRCQKCNCSSGESEIAKILDDNGITYIPQYTFFNCKDKKVLPFDFYIPNKNICIEYNGEQHYKPIEIFGGKDAFVVRKKHDKIKSEYCKNNNITLIEISYLDFHNIKDIIEEKVLC